MGLMERRLLPVKVGEALRRLAEAGPAPVYLVVGPETYLRRGFIDRLARHALGDGPEASLGLHRLEEADHHLSQVEEILRTPPLFGGRRLVVVREWEPLTVKAQAVVQRAVEALAKVLPCITEDTCLVFDMTAVEKQNPAARLLQEHALTVECQSLGPRETANWLVRRARERGSPMTSAAAALLASAVPGDLQQLERELDKVLLYAGPGRPVDTAEVEAVVSGSGQWRIFDLLDAVGEGRTGAALKVLHHLLATGEPPLRILTMLARHMRQLLQVKAMAERGYPPAEIRRRLQVHSFVAKKLQAQAGRLDSGRIAQGLTACCETDLAIKTGKLPPGLAVEMLVAGLVTTGRAKAQQPAGRS